MKAYLLLIVLVGVLFSAPEPVSVRAAHADQAGAPVFFSETGHTLAYQFRQFYERHGGRVVFGFPVSEVFIEEHRPVQYFAQAKLAWHADQTRVQMAPLGRWAAQGREHLPAFQPAGTAVAGGLFLPQSGHSVREPFLPFWQAHGGVDVFGYPISEAFEEHAVPSGQTRTVQYFERARLEWHPGAAQPVQVSDLGRRHLAAHPPPAWAVQPVDGPAQAWDAVRPTHVAIPRIGIATEVVETSVSAAQWEVPRYAAGHYWPISAHPGTGGNTIIAGHVGYSGIIFHSLPAVQVGDDVYVTAGGHERRYIVQEVLTLLPEDTWVLAPTATETLTLITCIPVGSYTHRLVVRATPGEA